MAKNSSSILRVVAIVLVLLCVLIELRWVSVSKFGVYNFWGVVLAFGIILFTSK